MLDTYNNFITRCQIEDLPNEQYFKDNNIALISTKSIMHDDRLIHVATDTYPTNIISQINLIQYKYIFAIKKVECIVGGTYSSFNINVMGIKHSAFNTSTNISAAEMSVLCLENSVEIGKVMNKYFGKG